MPTLDGPAVEALLAERSAEPVLLYFTTSWCRPCAVFGPIVAQFAAEHPELSVVRIDAEDAAATADRLRVAAYPSLVIVKDGEQLWHQAGTLSSADLEYMVDLVVEASHAVTAAPEAGGPTDHAEGATRYDQRGTVPLGAASRLTVTLGHAQLAPGEHYTIDADGGLRVVVRADARSATIVDLTPLDALTPEHVEVIEIRVPRLDAAQLSSLLRFQQLPALFIAVAAPLDNASLQLIAELQSLRLLDIDAPDLDVWQLRKALPDAVVNRAWLHEGILDALDDTASSELSSRARSTPAQRSVLPRLAEPDTQTAIVLVEQYFDAAGDDVVAALLGLDGVAVGTVDRAAIDQLPPSEGSSLVLLHAGKTVAVTDVCGPKHVAELAGLAAELQAQDGMHRGWRAPEPQAPRVIDRVPSRDVRVRIEPRAATPFESASLLPGELAVQMPAGWLISAEASDADIAEVLDLQPDHLQLRVQGDDVAAIIDLLSGLPALQRLTLIAKNIDDHGMTALARLQTLERLDLYLRTEQDEAVRLRALLPDTLVNEQWTTRTLGASDRMEP